MVGKVLLALTLSVTPVERVERCLDEAMQTFPDDSEEVRKALCLVTLERNDVLQLAQERLDALSTPPPPPRVVLRTDPKVVAIWATGGVVLGALLGVGIYELTR